VGLVRAADGGGTIGTMLMVIVLMPLVAVMEGVAVEGANISTPVVAAIDPPVPQLIPQKSTVALARRSSRHGTMEGWLN
jgi:hypothetical protein